jgi:hypothetical protein
MLRIREPQSKCDLETGKWTKASHGGPHKPQSRQIGQLDRVLEGAIDSQLDLTGVQAAAGLHLQRHQGYEESVEGVHTTRTRPRPTSRAAGSLLVNFKETESASEAVHATGCPPRVTFYRCSEAMERQARYILSLKGPHLPSYHRNYSEVLVLKLFVISRIPTEPPKGRSSKLRRSSS